MPQRLAKPFAIICVALLPLLAVTVLLRLQLGAGWLDYAPAWNDEIYHWHQAVSFAKVGFDSGYYVLNENPAPAQFSKAYTWGPFPYVYYGSLMRVVGIELYTVVLINAVTLMLAIGAALLLARPTWMQLGLLAAILLVFPPMLVYLPATMLEPLHQAVAVLAGVGVYGILTQRRPKTTAWLTTALLLCAGVMRPTWALLIPPVLFLAQEHRSWRTACSVIALSLLLIGAAAFVYYNTTSPYPHSRNYFIEGDAPLLDRIGGLLGFARASLRSLTQHPDAIILAHRAGMVVLIALLFGWGGWHLWRRRSTNEGNATLWEIAFHLYNLLAIYATIIMLHNTASGEDFRSMGAHSLLSMVVLALMRRRWLVGVMVVIWAVSFPWMLQTYEYKIGNFNGQVRAEFLQYASALSGTLVYDAEADNAWCNTITLSFQYLNAPPGLPLSVDPGMGLTHIWAWDETGRYAVPSTFKAKYLMLTADDEAHYAHTLPLERLADVPHGAVYRNLLSDCH